jgi:hypothetical protein
MRCAHHACESAIAVMERATRDGVPGGGMSEDDIWSVLHAENIRRGGEWRGTELASLDGTGLEENYEGLAIEPGPDGTLNAWLISDDNSAATQRTLLLRLQFRLADLPPRGGQTKQKAPG